MQVIAMQRLRISDRGADDRPRERLIHLGPSALTTVELVAIVLGTGTRRDDALSLADKVMTGAGGRLRRLARQPLSAIGKIPGVGPAKAARIMAAIDLARRMAAEGNEDRPEIRAPVDVFRWCGPRMRDLAVEEFHVLTLNVQNRVTRQILITRGILNGSLVHPREVFREAITESAAGIIVVHNHPSGDPEPSGEDRAVTMQLAEAGRLLDVPVVDHVIVGAGRYFSFAEAGLL